MSTPGFIRDLRAHIGHGLLFLPGVSAVVLDDAGRVLLGRRADNGLWALISGICEPGEQPAETAAREVYEETAVRCTVDRVLLVETLEPTRYPNGDACQFLDICVRAHAVGGEARVNDDESVEVGWFPLDGLPPLREFALARIKLATEDGPTWFAPGGEAPAAG
ncbi:NUDIX domain-containing protein [Streptomyces sp. MP131-18]|uniref:NUDIX hydrolase n=1 Tax=Streptomyces sp. MP131-18 TaxID=1857892 RepID=UPI00097C4F38|nr:NUDIX domain-containing protein [Streptomyces sp. MP131-18]ONK15794.1 RNA pyrophosphohydrolase [Streptomyces sp. MP131-18]